MRVRFWGTRGSLAKPGPETLRYGGNTSCVEVQTEDGTVLVLDCGTGAHDLGQALVQRATGPVNGHLLVTHTHWDHIQGFPFFAPLFTPENVWDLYAPGGMGLRLEAALSGQMEYTYFPVTLAQLGANIRFHDLTEGTFSIGNIRIKARYLNHPALTLGYRIEAGGATVVYATDHEPHSAAAWRSAQRAQPGDSQQVHVEDRAHVEFLSGADLVIHDCQYTPEEYKDKTGWGHSPIDYALEAAMAADSRRLALFHHDPTRTDDQLDRLAQACQQRAADSPKGLEVFAAAEGQTVILDESTRVKDPTGSFDPPSYLTLTTVSLDEKVDSVLVVDEDPETLRLLTLTLRPQGFRLLSAGDGEEALRVARTERPALILLDRNLTRRDGLEVCRLLRNEPDPFWQSVPIVLITPHDVSQDSMEALFDAGATDFLAKPFTPAYVRTRVRGWILRRHATVAKDAPNTP